MLKRRIVWFVVCVMLLVALLPGVANAMGNEAVNASRFESSVLDKSKDKTEKSYLKAYKEVERMVEKANRRIDQLVRKAQRTPENDVPQLLGAIDAIVSEVLAYASKVNVQVVCEYVEMYIDGQYVMIDPLIIIPL